MNILLVSNIFPPGFIGGYELGACEVAQGLAARGHELSVLMSDYFQDDEGQLGGMNIERTLACSFMSHEVLPDRVRTMHGFYVDNNNIRKLGSALRRLKPDLVMVFSPMGLGTVGILQFLQATRIPVILYLMDNVFVSVDVHSDIYAKFVSVFGRPTYGPGVKVIAMSRNVIREIREKSCIVFDNVLYIPGWVDFSRCEPGPVPQSDGKPVRFVVCSRIAPHKGVDLILDAAEALVRRNAREFSIDVYGAGLVGPFLQGVQMRKLGEFIRYCGCRPKDQMLKLFNQYDALLFPTHYSEAFGFTVSEAAAAGCFPIMTAGIGASEWFINDLDCIKIERTAQSLASAMYRTMAMSVDERTRFKQAAQKTARLNLSLDRWIEVIDRTCIEAARNKLGNTSQRSRGVQSAFLFLSHMWKESLGYI